MCKTTTSELAVLKRKISAISDDLKAGLIIKGGSDFFEAAPQALNDEMAGDKVIFEWRDYACTDRDQLVEFQKQTLERETAPKVAESTPELDINTVIAMFGTVQHAMAELENAIKGLSASPATTPSDDEWHGVDYSDEFNALCEEQLNDEDYLFTHVKNYKGPRRLG